MFNVETWIKIAKKKGFASVCSSASVHPSGFIWLHIKGFILVVLTFYFLYSVLLPVLSHLAQSKKDHLEKRNHLRQ